MTSLVGFALGDILAQVIAGGSYNLPRTLRMTSFGILMDGPVGIHTAHLHVKSKLAPKMTSLCVARLLAHPLCMLTKGKDLPAVASLQVHDVRAGVAKPMSLVAGHLWYTLLDKNVYPKRPKSNRAVVVKMLLDQLAWAPVFSCVFFTFMCCLEVSRPLVSILVSGNLANACTRCLHPQIVRSAFTKESLADSSNNEDAASRFKFVCREDPATA